MSFKEYLIETDVGLMGSGYDFSNSVQLPNKVERILPPKEMWFKKSKKKKIEPSEFLQ